jgi:hypothetical protein
VFTDPNPNWRTDVGTRVLFSVEKDYGHVSIQASVGRQALKRIACDMAKRLRNDADMIVRSRPWKIDYRAEHRSMWSTEAEDWERHEEEVAK